RAFPRSLWAIVPSSGEIVWQHDTRGNIQFLDAWKTDSEEDYNICFATYASQNRDTTASRNDDSCDIGLLNPIGQLLWQRTFEGPFSGIMSGILYDSSSLCSRLYGLVYRRGANPAKEPGMLVEFSTANGSTLHEVPVQAGLEDVYNIQYIQSTANSKAHIVVSTRPSGVTTFDGDLNVLRRWPDMPAIFTVQDFLAGGDPQLIAIDAVQSRTFAFDKNGTLLARYNDFFAPKATQQTRNDSLPKIWGLTKLGLVEVDFHRNPDFALEVLWWFTLNLVVPLTLIVSVVVSFRLRKAYVRTRRERLRMHEWAMSASSLAHDISTPVSVLQLKIQNFAMRLHKTNPEIDTSRLESDAYYEAERFKATVRQLRVLGKVDNPDFRVHDLGALVQATTRRLDMLGKGRIHTAIEPNLPEVSIDFRLIESLLENLIVNAIHATEDNGGEIVISLKRVTTTNAQNIEMTIQDKGKGIPEEKLKNIFEPYDSTKSGGTGLGMFRVRQIVELHRGTISTKSTVGDGTEVNVLLPC
ncbi:MAG: hypothetical protein KC583_24815, partial [Myxococcales bacterium]|nr:hypothetical protein [Myxococcales bacterium]